MFKKHKSLEFEIVRHLQLLRPIVFSSKDHSVLLLLWQISSILSTNVQYKFTVPLTLFLTVLLAIKSYTFLAVTLHYIYIALTAVKSSYFSSINC